MYLPFLFCFSHPSPTLQSESLGFERALLLELSSGFKIIEIVSQARKAGSGRAISRPRRDTIQEGSFNLLQTSLAAIDRYHHPFVPGQQG